ncbi:MAG: ferritin [Proteobacteria bacterium]|nr:ferritin [Pseudomonadota bacterium]
MSKVIDALNEQINKEFYSAYMYLSMSAHFSDLGLPGFANWMHIQAKEEMTHAMKIYHYILSRQARVILTPIDTAKTLIMWESPLEVFEASLEHERFVTASINDIVTLAIAEKDHATQIFLNWFVTEQVEEEESFSETINALRLINDNGYGLLMLDRELGARVFVDETAAAGN